MHVRKYIPGVYKGLVKDWPAITKWNDTSYWLEKAGNEYVEGIHYLSDAPFRHFAGGNVLTN